MVEFLDLDDRKSIASNGVVLRFDFAEDRWSHALESRKVARTFRSIEGGEDPRRIVSPTYQEVNVLDQGGVPRALAMGRSGPHHFSTAFSLETVGNELVVSVDLADRCRATLEALACTYVVDADSGMLARADSESVVWRDRDGSEFSLRALDGATLVPAEAGRRATRVQILARLLSNIHTQRCLYEWRFPV